MKLFLSYPSAERPLAERLALALEAEGHEVFFDRSDLAAGEAFHEPLREAVQAADAMVFLITPASVAVGSYTLAELEIARQRWRRPAGRVLPVMVAPTPMATLPPYLSAVTVLQPRGEPVAETVAAVARLGAGPGRRRMAVFAAVGLAIVAGAAGAAWLYQQDQRAQAAAAALQRDEAAARQALLLCRDGSHEAAMQQLAALATRQPPAPTLSALHEDCAMHWMREMRARSGEGVTRRTFDEQVRVIEPVLLQGLATATGTRAADLRAHIGWGAHLRWREGSGGGTDPVAHWQRALADDPGNVFAHAMWGNRLLPGRLAEARPHFEQAVASGRERAFVRRWQLGGSLGGDEEATAYAIGVADEMRRGGEALSLDQRSALWQHGFNRLLQRQARETLLGALPPAQALATYDGLFADGVIAASRGANGRFLRAMLQARAGEREAARAVFESLLQEQAQKGTIGLRIVDETKRELALLGR
jgi:hypothetical protein